MIDRLRRPEAGGQTAAAGIGLAILTALVSGVSVWVNASAVRAVGDPILFTTLKNGVAAVLLVAIAAVLVDRAPARIADLRGRDRLGLVTLGIIGGSVPFVLFFSGLASASAPSAALIHKTLFVWVALLAALLLRERLGVLQLAALGVLVVGQLLVQPADGLAWTSGETMIAVATGLWAIEVVIARRLLAEVPAPLAAASRMGLGLVVLIGWTAIDGRLDGIGALGAEQWAWIAATGMLLTAYVSGWYAALRRAPASAVTAVLTIGAPITAGIQLVADGRVPAPEALVGYAGIFAAAALIGWVALSTSRSASTASATG
ncbi:MAG TPA: EamA family transporter [Candidatus Limnocylindria bacterium]